MSLADFNSLIRDCVASTYEGSQGSCAERSDSAPGISPTTLVSKRERVAHSDRISVLLRAVSVSV